MGSNLNWCHRWRWRFQVLGPFCYNAHCKLGDPPDLTNRSYEASASNTRPCAHVAIAAADMNAAAKTIEICTAPMCSLQDCRSMRASSPLKATGALVASAKKNSMASALQSSSRSADRAAGSPCQAWAGFSPRPWLTAPFAYSAQVAAFGWKSAWPRNASSNC